MKKTIIILILSVLFSFAQETSDTIQTDKIDSLTIDSVAVSGEISDSTDSTVVLTKTDTIINSDEAEEIDGVTDSTEVLNDAEIVDSSADSVNLSEEEETEEIISDTIAKLTIKTTPDNAPILINRKRVGSSPWTSGELAPEEYNIMILKDGFEIFDTTITLAGGKNSTLSVNLISEDAAAAAEIAATDTTTEVAEADSTSADTTAAVTDADAAKKKKRMNRIGISVFLTIMLGLVFMQEYNNR